MLRGYARLRLELGNERSAEVVHSAVVQEVLDAPQDRARVRFMRDGSVLVVEVEAEDGSALRASLSSVMRWIRLADELGG
ncbi:MAG: hypothetical protein GXN98_00235 [Euryarchaeota archaeon]|nr:hypothetical protein [Euryarchaeota archaeon]